MMTTATIIEQPQVSGEFPPVEELEARAAGFAKPDWIYGYRTVKKPRWLYVGHTTRLEARHREHSTPRPGLHPRKMQFAEMIVMKEVERVLLDVVDYEDRVLAKDGERARTEDGAIIRTAAERKEIELCRGLKTFQHYGTGGLNFFEGDFIDEKEFVKPSAKTRPDRCLKLLNVILDWEFGSDAAHDEDFRAIYWMESSDEGKAIYMHLVDQPYSTKGGIPWFPNPSRILGFVDGGVLRTARDTRWHYHRKLGALTFNLHILKNTEVYGFDKVEVDKSDTGQLIVSVEDLLEHKKVPRKFAGNYESQIYYPYTPKDSL